MAQLNVVAQGDKAGGHRAVGDKVNSQRVGPIQPSVQRAARPPEARKDASRRTEQPPAARVTRFNAPAPDSPIAPPLPQGSWVRTLVIGLIIAALVPNITLAAVLWLGLIDPPWTKQEVPPQAAAQPATAAAVLTAPATLEATAGGTIGFPIALDGTDGVPARSIIAIKGLPPGSTLSDGRPYGDSEWDLTSDQIGDLHLALPLTARGEMQVAISLITPDDKVVTDTETVLKVAPAPSVPTAQSPTAQSTADDGGDQQTAATEPNEDDGAAAEEAASNQPASASSPSDGQTPETSASAKVDGQSTNWVTPSVYVNMRDGPSSSSSVIAVIAKGAKLPVLDRKRGWVQVSNPETSEKGWIYSGYVGGGHHVRSRKRAAAAASEPEQKSESSSFWGWLLQ